jgi:hypothetical protein
MLHPSVLSELLDDEVVVINERLAARGVTAQRDGHHVQVRAPELGENRILILDAERYDGEPVGVLIGDTDGHVLPGSEWPPGLCQGEHPILRRPFVCVRGTIDYHAHPSHTSDAWDRYRGRIRLADLVVHLLRRITS